AAGSATSGAAGGSGPALTGYSGPHPGTSDALVKAVEQKTGVGGKVYSGLDATLATNVALQGSHSPADVFVAENSPALEDLQQRKLLAKVDAGTLAQAPKGDS